MNWRRILPANRLDWFILVVGLPLVVWDMSFSKAYSGIIAFVILLSIGIRTYLYTEYAEQKKELRMVAAGILLLFLGCLAVLLFSPTAGY